MVISSYYHWIQNYKNLFWNLIAKNLFLQIQVLLILLYCFDWYLTWNLWSCQLLSTIELQNGLHRGTFVKSNLKEIYMVLCLNRQKVITMFSILHKVIRILELLNVIEHSYQNMWIYSLPKSSSMLVQSLMMCIVTFQLIFIHVAQCSLNNDDIVASIKVWQHHAFAMQAIKLRGWMNSLYEHIDFTT